MTKTQKQKALMLFLLFSISGITYMLKENLHPVFSTIRYLSLVYFITDIGYLFTAFLIRKKTVPFSNMYLVIGSILLLFYTVMTLDTFLFHALSWYPGILRYVLFSSYGICYLLFFPVGGFLAAGLHQN